MISVHLKSVPTEVDQGARETALSRIPQAVAPLVGVDADIIILGDFNTMGIRGYSSAEAANCCAPKDPG